MSIELTKKRPVSGHASSSDRQANQPDSNESNTPGVSRSTTKSKNYFKKYNSNKFNTINAASGFVNQSIQNTSQSHVQSTIQSQKGIKHKTRHSIELEKQYVLQKKYQDSLQSYPHRYTPTGYDSVGRPSSVIDTFM